MTKHSATCRMAFGRKDPSCARCVELLNGAAPRQLGYRPRDRKAEDLALSQAIRAHDCKRSGCGVVCTAFQW
jgi:hypothetical protein